MKKTLTLSLLLTISVLSYGQKQFISKPEALTWLKETFSKYFVKSAVNETENKKNIGIIESDASQYFDYEFTDKYLLVSRRARNLQMTNWFVLLPFDKISRLNPVSSSEYAFYKQATHIYIKSDCNCFKYSEGKKFKGEEKFDELRNSILFPFNLNEEKAIGESLKNAFDILAGNTNQINHNVEERKTIITNNIIEKYTLADVANWKKLYADISLPNQKNDLSKNDYHGHVKKVKKTYNNVEESSSGQQILKKNFIVIEEYNSTGYITEREFVSEDHLPEITDFEYSNKDLIIAKIALKDSSIISRFTYDKLLTGGIQKMEIQDNNLAKMTSIYNNDDLIEIKSEMKSDQKTNSTKFKNKYDKFSNIISTDIYEDEILTSSYQYEFNNRNVCTKTICYDSKGIIQWTFEPKFDNNNRTIETNKIDIDKNVQKVSIEKFDTKNNILVYKVYKNGQLKEIVETEIEYY